jgi:polyisoprenoid-binding protein YceI
MKRRITAMTATATATAVTPTTTTWSIDPAHSAAEFKVKHMMISNGKSQFNGMSGTLTLNEADPGRSQVEASIPVATISTGDAQRDAHLKSADFFDAEKFPNITFKSTSMKKLSENDWDVAGSLTIHGVTNLASLRVEDVSAPAKDPWGNTRVGLSATTRINRKEYGLNWNAALEAGGWLVGDEVQIMLDVEFIKG